MSRARPIVPEDLVPPLLQSSVQARFRCRDQDGTVRISDATEVRVKRKRERLNRAGRGKALSRIFGELPLGRELPGIEWPSLCLSLLLLYGPDHIIFLTGFNVRWTQAEHASRSITARCRHSPGHPRRKPPLLTTDACPGHVHHAAESEHREGCVL